MWCSPVLFALFLHGGFALIRSTFLAACVALVFASFTFGTEPPAVKNPPAVKGTDKYDPSAACVRVTWKQWGASGTCIASEGGQSLVLTCNHLYYEQPQPGAPFLLGAYPLSSKVTVAGKEYAATAIGGDADADLALVVVDGTLPVAEIAERAPRVGSRVRHYGLGSGGGSGDVLAPPANVARLSMQFRYSAVSESGDSGAGVFDENGKLCAVHCGRDGMGRLAPARGTPVASVLVVVKQHASPRMFPRLRERLGAKPAPMKSPEPPAIPAPKKVPSAPPPAVPTVASPVTSGGCVGGVCKPPSRPSRPRLFR